MSDGDRPRFVMMSPEPVLLATHLEVIRAVVLAFRTEAVLLRALERRAPLPMPEVPPMILKFAQPFVENNRAARRKRARQQRRRQKGGR